MGLFSDLTDLVGDAVGTVAGIAIAPLAIRVALGRTATPDGSPDRGPFAKAHPPPCVHGRRLWMVRSRMAGGPL